MVITVVSLSADDMEILTLIKLFGEIQLSVMNEN